MVKLAIADYADSRSIRGSSVLAAACFDAQELRAEIRRGAGVILGAASWGCRHGIDKRDHGPRPLVIVARPGTAFNGKLPLHLVREWEHRYTSDPHALSATPAGAFIRQPITPQAISASTIRAALARGELTAVRSLLPAAVLAYIERNRLYGFNRLYGSRAT
jgi:hypothetical protein